MDLLHVYAFCWNQVELVPYFLRNYDAAGKIVVFDDMSDDGSRDLLLSDPRVELRNLGGGDSYVRHQTEHSNDAWKASKGESRWVIVTSLDEFIGPDLADALDRHYGRGDTLVIPKGYHVISEEPCAPPDAKLFVPDPDFDRKNVFRPDMVDHVSYGAGNHAATFSGHIRTSPSSLRMLHYRYLGRRETLARYRVNNGRLRGFDRLQGWGCHYGQTDQEFNEEFDRLLKMSSPECPPELTPATRL